MSPDYWTSKAAEQRVYGIPHGRLWRVYSMIKKGSRTLMQPNRIDVNDSLTASEVLSWFNIKSRSGSTYFMIKCPSKDHDDKHPSCAVWRELKRFKCYSCGVSGDLVELYRLLRESEGISKDGVE